MQSNPLGDAVRVRVRRGEVVITISRELFDGGGEPTVTVEGEEPARSARGAIESDSGSEAPEPPPGVEMDATGTSFVGLTAVPADRIAGGFSDFTVRADLAESYRAVFRQVRALGGIVTSSGGLRDLSEPATPGRSKTSLHYTARAIDLFISTAMQPTRGRYVVVRDGGVSDDHPLWKLYCEVGDPPNPADPLFDPALVVETDLQEATWVKGTGVTTSTRHARVICLTDLMQKNGWMRIPSRSDWRTNYLSLEWWHFQNQTGLVSGRTTFGEELRRAWPAAKVAASGLALNAVWGSQSFRIVESDVMADAEPAAGNGRGARARGAARRVRRARRGDVA